MRAKQKLAISAPALISATTGCLLFLSCGGDSTGPDNPDSMVAAAPSTATVPQLMNGLGTTATNGAANGLQSLLGASGIAATQESPANNLPENSQAATAANGPSNPGSDSARNAAPNSSGTPNTSLATAAPGSGSAAGFGNGNGNGSSPSALDGLSTLQTLPAGELGTQGSTGPSGGASDTDSQDAAAAYGGGGGSGGANRSLASGGLGDDSSGVGGAEHGNRIADLGADAGKAGNAGPMGSRDPANYFSLLKSDDDIFKIVERRYISKSKQWALADLQQINQAVMGSTLRK